MWQNWTNLTIGVWLLTAAFIPAVTTSRIATRWDNSLVGGIALLLGMLAAVRNRRQTMCWINAVIGAWLLVSAFIPTIVGQLGFWNDLSAGVLIIAVSTWAIIRTGSSNVAHG